MMENKKTPQTNNLGNLEKSLPSTFYYSNDIFKVEQEQIFCKEWLCVAREEDIPNAGDNKVIEIAGESILLLRNRDGALRSFYNVCRHRGSRLCTTDPTQNPETGRPLVGGGCVSSNRIVCPYHFWSYDFDGNLVTVPHMDVKDDVRKKDFGLHPVGIESWGGFIFINLTPATATPFEESHKLVVKSLKNYPLSSLRIGKSIRYEVDANWKIIVENYNECYHCGPVHPELCEIVPVFRQNGGDNLDWERGVPHREGAYTFTKTGTTNRAPFDGLSEDEKVLHKGEIIYPSVMISLSCDHVAAFVLEAKSPTQTIVTCHFLFAPEEMEKEDFDASDAVDFWHIVNLQDWEICVRVQKGLESRVNHFGYYAPMEDTSLDIRNYVLGRIRPHLSKTLQDELTQHQKS
ncbi:MAG: aromatic ring-hydroxylating dioxygenase subunit alpha [Emcibacter sp.]|nr:aromatic ring-hydroxylating dioxygenase subunit alpha [Emcibacter sp.]